MDILSAKSDVNGRKEKVFFCVAILTKKAKKKKHSDPPFIGSDYIFYSVKNCYDKIFLNPLCYC